MEVKDTGKSNTPEGFTMYILAKVFEDKDIMFVWVIEPRNVDEGYFVVVKGNILSMDLKLCWKRCKYVKLWKAYFSPAFY